LRDLFPKNRTNHKTRKEPANQKWIHICAKLREIRTKLLGAVAQTDYTGDFVKCPAATQASFEQPDPGAPLLDLAKSI